MKFFWRVFLRLSVNQVAVPLIPRRVADLCHDILQFVVLVITIEKIHRAKVEAKTAHLAE